MLKVLLFKSNKTIRKQALLQVGPAEINSPESPLNLRPKNDASEHTPINDDSTLKHETDPNASYKQAPKSIFAKGAGQKLEPIMPKSLKRNEQKEFSFREIPAKLDQPQGTLENQTEEQNKQMASPSSATLKQLMNSNRIISNE